MSDLFIARLVAVCALAFCGISALTLIAALCRFDPPETSANVSPESRRADAVPAEPRTAV